MYFTNMDTTHEPQPHEQILQALAKLGQFMRAHDWQVGTPIGLTPTQIAILRYLDDRKAAGIGAVARNLSVSQPTASDAIRVLMRKGLVERSVDPHDRRAASIALTPAGKAQLRTIDGPSDPMVTAMDGLNDDERDRLQRALIKIIRELQQSAAIPVQRMCLTCIHFAPNAHDDPAKPHHCNFVDAAFGDGALRVNCGDHEPAEHAAETATWARFTADTAI